MFRFFICFLLLITQLSVHAADRVLFKFDGSYGYKYSKHIENLASGDRLHFSNGAVFTVDNVLGSGRTTKVVSIRELPDVVLRLAKSKQNSIFLDDYYHGAKVLIKNQIPHPHVYSKYKSEYVLVEKIHEPFILLSDFIIYNQLHEKKNFEQLIQNHFQLSVFDLRNQLEDFFVKIGKLNQASDFHEENIVYDFNQKKWIYLDWLNSFEENLPSQLNNQKIGINELLDRFGQFKDYQFSITDQKNLKWFEHIINRAIKRIIINRKTNQTKYLCEKVFQ